MGMKGSGNALLGTERQRRVRGASLVETQVAAAVFAVGVASLMPLTVATVRSGDTAGARTRSLALAQSKAEEFRSLPYDEFANLAPGVEVLSNGYKRQWADASVPLLTGDGKDLRRVLITVSWDLPGTGSGSVTVPTSRGRY